ncbi:MAG TPA: glycoside hydrolase family 3 N-terminal domain-containing protein [Streptosporangiaceae bacterium]|nr:glycoside hydrolase family 3 N-terminal domain-containing protein [Streptosporangiaceae bacterium]
MTTHSVTDASLTRLADGLLIPPFPGYSAPRWVLAALADGLAGVTVFGPNIVGQAQLGTLIAALRGAAHEPLIAIDEEGGDVTRIAHQTGSPYPGNAALGAVDDPALTESVYLALGRDLAALGVNLNLAPSVDVNTAADNPVIGTRSFGADTDLVARHAAAAVTGLQAAGVAACAKHFPGHGSTSNDSHHVIAAVDGSLEVVTRRDLPPFVAAIEAGVRAVMPGHLRVPGLTGDLPASLSAAALTGLLRGELGFTGVIVSDALEMRAVSGPFGIARAAVLAVAAGTDLLCFGRDTDEPAYVSVRDALVDAVRSGHIPVARLEESAGRVAELRGWAAERRSGRGSQGGSPPGTEVGLAAARRAIQVTGTPRPMASPVLVELVPPSNIAVGTVPWGLSTWVAPDSVRRIATSAAMNGASGYSPGTVADVLAAAAGRPLLVVVRDAHRYPMAQEIVGELLTARPDAVIVEMGLPVWHPPAQVYLATFGATSASSLAVAELLGLTR